MSAEPIVFHGTEYHILFPDLMRELTPEEDADLGEKIKERGRVVKPIITDGMRGIVDGAHRLRWAVKLGLEKSKVPFSSDGKEMNADQQEVLCREVNDTGRQDPFKVRQQNRKKRVERVAEARQQGKTTREIAETEGVSQTQVQRDLNTAESESVEPGGGSTETNGTPASPKVKGKDGKSYASRKRPPKKPPKPCERCGRIGAPSCTACKKKFPHGFPKPAKDREPGSDDGDVDAEQAITDAEGEVVPDQAIAAFKAVPVLEALGRECDALRHAIEEAAKGPAGRLLQSGLPGIQQKLKDAKGVLMANRPSHVCPYCHGKKGKKPCDGCKGEGWVAKHIYSQAPKGAVV